MNTTRHLVAAAALLLATPLAALAQPDGDRPPPENDGHHRGPPPEAIAACQGKAVGTQASFTDRDGRTTSGACTKMDDVVAVPPPRHPHGPLGGASQPRP